MGNLLHKLNWPKLLLSWQFQIFVIFVWALFVRTYKLGVLPFGFHSDEVVNTYVGRYILTNGQDLWGNSWPMLYFDKFGDFPPVLPMYLAGIATYFFGLTEFAARLPAAVAGAGTVVAVFLVSRRLFSTRLALLAAFLLSITPWHIVLSRASAEGIIASAVFLFGLWQLLVAWEKQSLLKYLVSVGLFFGTYFLYPSFRIIIPLFLLGAWWLTPQKLKISATIILLLFSVTTFSISQTTWGRGRFQQTSVFYYNNRVQDRLQQYITSFETPSVFQAKLFHNKPVGFIREIAFQYGQYLSPAFLFSRGGLPMRYSIPDQGQFYYSYGLILLLGIGSNLLNSKKKTLTKTFTHHQSQLMLLLLYLLLISILPAALTADDAPNVHRSLLFSIIIIFPLVAAWRELLSVKIGPLILTLLIVLTLGEGMYFWHQYSGPATHHQTLFRRDENRQHALYLRDKTSQYDQVYASSHESLPFYYAFFSHNLDQGLAGTLQPEMKIDRVGIINFLDHLCPSYIFPFDPTQSTLIIDRSECQTNPYLTEIDSINRVTQSQAYRVLTTKPDTDPGEFTALQQKLRGVTNDQK